MRVSSSTTRSRRAPGEPARIDEDDAAVIFYTSGTTGRPKEAISSYRGMISHLQKQLFLWLLGRCCRYSGHLSRRNRKIACRSTRASWRPPSVALHTPCLVSEVKAIVRLDPGPTMTADDVRGHVAEKLAGSKVTGILPPTAGTTDGNRAVGPLDSTGLFDPNR